VVLRDLPTLNAALNATSALLLSLGFWAIRRRHRRLHRRLMLAALATSSAFLISYVVYHVQVGSVRFTRPEPMLRVLYFALLLSHTVLAATVPPLALRTVWLALKGDFVRHRRWARCTLPTWWYVSATGVAIYVVLHVR